MVRNKVRKEQNINPTTLSRAVSPYWYYGLVLLIVLFFALIRVRMLDFPLERDEGEYAYAGQLILQGIPPYELAYNMKLPGTYAAYSLILAIFGQTPRAVHLGLLFVNAATSILMYFLARRLFGSLAGIVSCASYALLSAGSSILGFAGHATHFVILPAIGGILLLLRGLESDRLSLLFWGGLSLGLAFIMKQPGIFFVLFAGLYLAVNELKLPINWMRILKRGGLFFLGAIIPFAATCLILFRAGVFPKFWFWTFSYARAYANIFSLTDGIRNFEAAARSVISPAIGIWIVAGAGLMTFIWHRKARIHPLFTLCFLLFSFAAICPGFYFRTHYFVLLLPAIALLTGIAVTSITRNLFENDRWQSWSSVPVVLFLIAFTAAIFQQRAFFFEMDAATVYRKEYGTDIFSAALKVADYLRTHSSKKARIAVLGSEPEIYFYANRHSATGYIYTYALMEKQPFASIMQREMISEIEAVHPEFMVYVFLPSSWIATADSDKTIFSWAGRYAQTGYQVVGVADVFPDRTEYYWDDEAKSYEQRSPLTIFVFKRAT